ncbi:MAG: cyclase [Candidatus Nanopelagicales bacterium]
MTTLAVRHSVSDFDTWKSVFDGHASVRAGHGATSHRVLHDGNAVLVLIDFPDAASARSFMADPALVDAMARGGVVGAPDVSVLVDAA